MATLTSKVKYGLWFFRKGYFTQFFHELKASIFSHPEVSSLDWCKQKAITQRDFFQQLELEPRSVQSDFPSYLNFAKHKEKKCPIKMGDGSPMNLLYNLIIYHKPRYVVETGVAYGYSTLAILLGFKNSEEAHLWSIDMPYPNLDNEEYVGCAVKDDLKNKWSLIRQPEVNGLPVAINECHLIDLFHYDSDRRYSGRMNTFKMAWSALKMGGHLVCVDIQTNQAFKDFTELTGRDPIVISFGKRYVGLIKK